ncbi:MAG: hypothetical protein E3J52_05680 [Promethearchaeota archaeon]|nr:MAG: hypothetical protein E3J52_05680 [Candidatus Lokiarchaeota archaeon]
MKKDLEKNQYELCRLWLESFVITYGIRKFLTENRDKAYNINEIFDIVITPFYSNTIPFLPFVKTIREYCVIEGKINRIEINGELFYHA